MEFPTSPAIGTQVTLGALSWTYDGSAWGRTLNNGQLATVLTAVTGLIELTVVEIPNLETPFTLITHI